MLLTKPGESTEGHTTTRGKHAAAAEELRFDLEETDGTGTGRQRHNVDDSRPELRTNIPDTYQRYPERREQLVLIFPADPLPYPTSISLSALP